jgi:hypothetical protein
MLQRRYLPTPGLRPLVRRPHACYNLSGQLYSIGGWAPTAEAMMRVPAIRVVAGLALVVAPVVGAIGLSSLAGAASPTTCSGVVGKVQGDHATLSGCTAATTGGSGVLASDPSANGDLVKWSNGGTTIFKFKPTRSNAAKNTCPSGKIEDHLQSKVIESTGAATAVTGRVSAYLCFPSSGKGNVTVMSGTLWRF